MPGNYFLLVPTKVNALSEFSLNIFIETVKTKLLYTFLGATIIFDLSLVYIKKKKNELIILTAYASNNREAYLSNLIDFLNQWEQTGH